MKKKQIYITPQISVDAIEEENDLCLISVYAPDKPGENWGGDFAKRSGELCFDNIFDDPFAEKVEETANDFQYSLDID